MWVVRWNVEIQCKAYRLEARMVSKYWIHLSLESDYNLPWYGNENGNVIICWIDLCFRMCVNKFIFHNTSISMSSSRFLWFSFKKFSDSFGFAMFSSMSTITVNSAHNINHKSNGNNHISFTTLYRSQHHVECVR